MTEVEGTGETVGEAKWAALRELEQRHPGLDKARVSFVVLSEGERGLLGVGYTPARVLASVPGEATTAPQDAAALEPAEAPDSPAGRLRAFVERVCSGLGVSASIEVEETPDELVARLEGRDVALLIGKHGQTLDAIQYLANATLNRDVPEDERRRVVVDAAGYRDRRAATLERAADRAADSVLSTGEPVALERMTAAERKIVHTYLQSRPEVTTASEGSEPNRYVVVRKAGDR